MADFTDPVLDSDAQLAPAALLETLTTEAPHDPYAALRYRDFRLLAIGRFIASLGEQMVSVAIGWELYDRTGSALALGLVGLVQVLPVIVLSLPAGQVADRFDRKRVVIVTQILLALCGIGLAVLSYTRGSLFLVYTVLLFIGIARAFNNPAASSLLPQTVPPGVFTSAATWSSSAWQFAAVTGLALGGLLIGIFNHAGEVYILDAVAALTFGVLVAMIRGKQIAHPKEVTTFKSLAAGVGFVLRTKIILATITLDMFAVLLGGATTLLPIFAKDIMQVGPAGLGVLRAAPSIGAILMVLLIAHMPPFKHAGRTLLLAVIGFGLATIVFGVSRSFLLSLVMLALLGALDNISVVIRSTLLLVRAPDEMRGRISAVNNVFIGTSNELGGFESGLTAALFGPVLAVVGGGIGTILVVLAIAWFWPEVRRLGRLDEGQVLAADAAAD
ncbi:MAG: MFS transporter [Chloroflexota bacterium]